MRPASRVWAVMAAPVLLAGLLVTGSAGFRSTSTLNVLSDRIDFTGYLIVGGSNFTINSISCTLHDQGSETAIPCRLGGAGAITNPATFGATSDVTITGPDGVITFHQTAARGCATGTGIEIERGVGRPVPVRVEGSSSSRPVSPQLVFVQGSISVYEAGAGPPIGIDCLPD